VSTPGYSLEAWRRLRERRGQQPESSKPAEPTLAEIPPDAEMDDGITLGCWNGERFVSWADWIAGTTFSRAPSPEADAELEAAAYIAECGATRVWLVRDGDRWLMFAGKKSASTRRRDFASPWLDHAKRTAEAWYGAASKGWIEQRSKQGAA